MAAGLVVGMVRDLYFGTHLVAWVRHYGHEYRGVDTAPELVRTLRSARPSLVIVDLELEPGDLGEIARAAGGARLVAYGPPQDPAIRQAAADAGFHEVMLNIVYHRECSALLARNLNAQPIESNGHAPAEPNGHGRSGEGGGLLRRLWPRG